MSIEGLRDLAIIVVAFVGSVVLIVRAVVYVLLYRRITSVLGHLSEACRNLEEISSLIKDEIAKPLIQVACLIQGVRQGIELVKQFMQTREEGGKQ
ncbi:MAG: hypothetical protein HYY32_05650 [Chloroflexi bacterium]|nr:hypothetical protein [Chloroflexota bacterium]